MHKPNYIFKAGDRVSWCGMRGTVIDEPNDVLHVKWDNGVLGSILEDGRIWKEQTRPVLKLLKKKKRESVDGWMFKKDFNSPSTFVVHQRRPSENYVRVRITKIRDEK